MKLILAVIFVMIFLYNESNNNSVLCKSVNDGFITSQHVAPFNVDNYRLNNPDTEYYYDRSGLKGNLFKNYQLLPNNDKPEIDKPEIDKPEIDNFNSVINKLELYYEDVYK
jgi:hypothetical protein